MKIKNFDELAVTEARKTVLSIAEAGLEAIDTERILKDMVTIDGDLLIIDKQQFSLKDIHKIMFIGIGKCAVEAGIIFEEMLGSHLAGGAVIDVKSTTALKKLTSFKGSHPLPSEENIAATRHIVDSLNGLGQNDLVIFLISGGGSTLLCLPEKNGSTDEIAIIKALMSKGATIQETNTVRKHLSLARGGYLAKHAYPANVVSLIFSDVPGNDITFIASGPTCKDTTTVEDAKKVLEKYNIAEISGVESPNLIETPKEDKYFKKVQNILALSNETALNAMAKKATELGATPQIVTHQLTGEADAVGKKITEEIHRAQKNTVLLYGGETTVTMHGNGRGGRNLELGLAALQYLDDDEIFVTIASDGRDNGAFGGAVCDTATKKAIETAGLSLQTSLQDNNAYPLFEKIGNYLMMGDTGSNVADLIIAMKI